MIFIPVRLVQEIPRAVSVDIRGKCRHYPEMMHNQLLVRLEGTFVIVIKSILQDSLLRWHNRGLSVTTAVRVYRDKFQSERYERPLGTLVHEHFRIGI